MEPLGARHLFPIVERYIHVNHAGVSPTSHGIVSFRKPGQSAQAVLRDLSAANVSEDSQRFREAVTAFPQHRRGGRPSA